MFIGSQRFSCRLVNLSASRALLLAPHPLKPNTLVRLNLKVPGLDELIDVDAIVTGETSIDGAKAWDVKFTELGARAGRLLSAYISACGGESDGKRPAGRSRPQEPPASSDGRCAEPPEKAPGPLTDYLNAVRLSSLYLQAVESVKKEAQRRPSPEFVRSVKRKAASDARLDSCGSSRR
jgi:hypothetical protein